MLTVLAIAADPKRSNFGASILDIKKILAKVNWSSKIPLVSLHSSFNANKAKAVFWHKSLCTFCSSLVLSNSSSSKFCTHRKHAKTCFAILRMPWRLRANVFDAAAILSPWQKPRLTTQLRITWASRTWYLKDVQVMWLNHHESPILSDYQNIYSITSLQIRKLVAQMAMSWLLISRSQEPIPRVQRVARLYQGRQQIKTDLAPNFPCQPNSNETGT